MGSGCSNGFANTARTTEPEPQTRPIAEDSFRHVWHLLSLIRTVIPNDRLDKREDRLPDVVRKARPCGDDSGEIKTEIENGLIVPQERYARPYGSPLSIAKYSIDKGLHKGEWGFDSPRLQ